MTLVFSVQLTVGTHKHLTFVAVDTFLMVVFITVVLASLQRGLAELRPTTQQSKVLCQFSDIAIVNVVDATASGAFEFVAGMCCSKAAGIPACGSPLPPGIANVEHHLVKFFFICLSGQEFLKALWFERKEGGGGGKEGRGRGIEGRRGRKGG